MSRVGARLECLKRLEHLQELGHLEGSRKHTVALNLKLLVAHCGVFLHLMQFSAGVVATLFAHLNGCCDKLFAVESDEKEAEHLFHFLFKGR